MNSGASIFPQSCQNALLVGSRESRVLLGSGTVLRAQYSTCINPGDEQTLFAPEARQDPEKGASV